MRNWGVKRLIIQYILSILICLPIHQNNIPWQDFKSEVKKKNTVLTKMKPSQVITMYR